jgi:hypothetical protein
MGNYAMKHILSGARADEENSGRQKNQRSQDHEELVHPL